MKIEFELIQEDPDSSLRLLHERVLSEKFSWQYHYHPEYELVFVLAGSGTRQVGNHISSYDNGDLVLIGPELPHSGFGLNARGMIEQVVVQFKKDMLGDPFLQRPEMKIINTLLERAAFGICFGEQTRQETSSRLTGLFEKSPFDRFMTFIEILHVLASATDYRLLNNRVMLPSTIRKMNMRLQNIFSYAERHYQDEIDIKAVADIANLTVPAFCNYFKKTMHITYTEFVNQYRIEQACRLLQQDKSVGEVCFACGFNNVPYFNKVFKHIIKKTPSAFKKVKAIALQTAVA